VASDHNVFDFKVGDMVCHLASPTTISCEGGVDLSAAIN
jgi:hypothetical protein